MGMVALPVVIFRHFFKFWAGHATVDDVGALQRAVVATIYKRRFARCCFGCMLVVAFANRKLRISVIA